LLGLGSWGAGAMRAVSSSMIDVSVVCCCCFRCLLELCDVV
jgi:hypothetical protein